MLLSNVLTVKPNKEHVGLLLSLSLLNLSTSKDDVLLRAAFASVFLTPVLWGKVLANEELPAVDEDQDWFLWELDLYESETSWAVSEGAGKT